MRRWIDHEHPLDRAQQDIDLISQRATRYFNNARDAHLSGDLALAIEDYRRALTANPHHFGARLGLAQSLHESNELAAAIAEYEKAYQMDPSSTRDGLVSARLALGEAHRARGNLDAAAAELEQVLRLAPSDDQAQRSLIDIWIKRGEDELAAGRYTQAVEAFSRALTITPDDPSAPTRVKSNMRLFSEAAEERGMWEMAFVSLSRLAEALPDDEQLQSWLNETRLRWRAHNYFEMARRAYAVGDQVTAVEECRRALQANPSHSQARLLLASLRVQAGDLSPAIEEYELAYRLDASAAGPGLAQARLQRAVELEAQDDLVAAVADYERALEVHPSVETARRRLPDIWMRWGDDHLAAGRLDQAVNHYRKSLLVAEQPQTLARPIKTKLAEFSQAQRSAGNWDAAVAAIARLRTDLMLRDRESDGWLVDVWMQRGDRALLSGQYREAARAFKQALLAARAAETSPERSAAESKDAASLLARVKSDFFAYADDRAQAEQPDAAIAALTMLVEVVGSDADTFVALSRAWLARGMLHFKHDRLDEAESAFHRALELQPDNPEAFARLTSVTERRRQFDVERLRAEAAAHVERRDWMKAEVVYRQLVFEFHDERAHQAFAEVSEEIRLEELYNLAQSYQAKREWNAAIPIWLEICHVRREYTGRDGQNAALLLAEAIRRHAGVAQASEWTAARLKQRAQLAWIVAVVFGLTIIGLLVYLLANGPLKAA